MPEGNLQNDYYDQRSLKDELVNMKLGIFGVGRSGTTAVYVGVQSLILAEQQNKYGYFYEPYLWSHSVFNAPYSEIQNKFGLTSSISIDGVYAHCKTPLFVENSTPEHDHFMSEVFDSSDSFLVKSIRACGRLKLYLEHFPDLKLIYIVRNPLDTVNSVINLFSFYGDEFHPSDKDRFTQEVSLNLGFKLPNHEDLNEAKWSFIWWKYMNLAALKAAQEYPDRVFIIAYEAFRENPSISLQAIAEFFEIAYSDRSLLNLERPVGPYTSRINLTADDVQFIKTHDDSYWEDIVALSKIPLQASAIESKERIYQRYIEESMDSRNTLQEASIPTNWTGVKLRKELSRLKSSCSRNPRDLISYIDLKEQHKVLKATNEDLALRLEQSFEVRKKCKREQRRLLDEIRLMQSSYAGLLNQQPTGLNQARRDIVHLVENSRPLKLLKPFTRLQSSLVEIASKLEVKAFPADISCVITSYNNVPYLKEAVYSVLAQTIPVKEIIIADDGSTDGSRELINSLASEFSNIRPVFRESNVGPGLNRHLAIIEATGEFITQLDGDDTLYHLKLAREFETLSKSRDSIVYSDFVLDEPKVGLTTLSTQYFSELSTKHRVLSVLRPEKPLPHNMLYSKKIYVEVGGYDTSALMYEDWSLKMRLAASGMKWIHVPVKGLVYRLHGSGLSSSKPFTHLFWRFYVMGKNFDWLYEYIGCRKILAALIFFIGSIKHADIYKDLDSALNRLLTYIKETDCVDEVAGILNIALINLVKSKHLSRKSEEAYAALKVFSDDLQSYEISSWREPS